MASGFWQAENLSKLGAGLIGPRSHSQSSLSLSLSLISNRPHSYGVPCSNVRVQLNIPTSNGCLISVQSFLELFTSDIGWQLGVCKCWAGFLSACHVYLSSEMPPHIASYLPEVLLAKAKTTAAEIMGKAEHVPATSPPKDSSVAVCPRPLKHRRITPSAVIINSPPSDGKIDHIAPREAASDLPASLGEPHCVIPAVTTVDLPSSPSAAALHHSMLNPC